ncbi:MAG: fructose-bisphosphate aldolase [archaeon]
MKVNINSIMKDGKTIILAYDQGLEHGPSDFDDKNVDPKYILDIAKNGKFNGLVLQKGIAEKYYTKAYSSVPLILKLNGKTNFVKGDPIAPQLCSVKEAIKIGAKAVGYTIYVGSAHESEMFREFEKIEEEAHQKGIPVIAWMYPRGEAVKDELERNTLAYAARIGLELGADMIKMKYNHNPDDLKWVIKNAGETKVVIAGGLKEDESKLMGAAREIIDAGACGLAIGRNIWQNSSPLEITNKLKSVIWK